MDPPAFTMPDLSRLSIVTPRKSKTHSISYHFDTDDFKASKVEALWATTVMDNLKYEQCTIDRFFDAYVP
jgi:hypothetical protein